MFFYIHPPFNAITRVHLRQLIEQNVTHPLIATQQEIVSIRQELQRRLQLWRQHQLTVHMQAAKITITNRPRHPLERDDLYLPSEFSEEERRELGLVELANLEAELWEAHASECILQLRSVGKTVSAFRGLRGKEPGSQRQGTRNTTRFQHLEFLQSRILTNYGDSRKALDSLGRLSTISDRFPHLTHADLFRKSTQNKRTIGDTHRPDGAVYGLDVRLNGGLLPP
jgi:hypothetical protein